MLAGVRRAYDADTNRNAERYHGGWIGYRLHIVMLTQRQNVACPGSKCLASVGKAEGAWMTPCARGMDVLGCYPHSIQSNKGTFSLCVDRLHIVAADG